jgi:ribosomal protein S18 acetylase RimI-like enzyme
VAVSDESEVLRALPLGTEDYAYISSMAVSEPCRRRGLARALLAVAGAQAAAWSQRHLALHVYDNNTPAVALYQAAGFDCLQRDPGW